MDTKRINRLISHILTLISIFVTFSLMTTTFAGSEAVLDDDVRGILENVLNVLLTVAGIACVGKILHIGILYMTSSAVEKSNAKTALLPWIIGNIVCSELLGLVVLLFVYLG